MPDQPLLGVTRSATGRAWGPRLDAAGERNALALAQRQQLPELVARVLAGRGVSVDNAETELSPTIRALLPDPSSLTDCDRLVALLADALDAGASITLFADYDVDGATSAAVVANTLKALGASPSIVVPDRVTEGYGPSVEAMERIADAGARVLLTLDCGAGAVEAIARAKARGLTVLVVDHHPVDALGEADAIVNPNRPDDLSGLGACAAVGVAFVVMVGLVREARRRGRFAQSAEPNLMALLDCVALGTVADVVPLTALNRAFVIRGLKALRNRTNPGLAALVTAARIGGPVDAQHLGYVLGPRINAGGRIGEAGLGARLLTTDDQAEAETIAAELDRLNEARRAMERAALEEATVLADPDAAVIVVAGAWHPGVVGLVAARLKERFRRPAIAIALSGSTGTGSARSIPGVDLGTAVREAHAEGHLIKGGGHAMAAGLTVEIAALPALIEWLQIRLRPCVSEALASDRLVVDALAAPGAIDEPLARALAERGPWGADRPKPVLALEGAIVERVIPVGADSLRVTLRGLTGPRLEAMVFRASGPVGDRLRAARGEMVHCAVEVGHSVFRGVPRAEAVIVDVADVEPALRRAA